MDAVIKAATAVGWPVLRAGRLGRNRYRPREGIPRNPKRPEQFRLRLARYCVLAQDISDWAAEAAAQAGRAVSVLDVGCGWGPLLCQLEGEPNFANVAFSGTDLTDHPQRKRQAYREFFVGDLTRGYPEIPSNHYDVVVCEQVLEHLDRLDAALAMLVRVVRPGGVLIIGVPIFFPPLHLARKYLVPRFGRYFGHSDTASHVQAFSLFSFRRLLKAYPQLRPVKTRGFRIVSGGLLRKLENRAWWWRFNRRLGELLPALCIEVQVVLEKLPSPPL